MCVSSCLSVSVCVAENKIFVYCLLRKKMSSAQLKKSTDLYFVCFLNFQPMVSYVCKLASIYIEKTIPWISFRG